MIFEDGNDLRGYTHRYCSELQYTRWLVGEDSCFKEHRSMILQFCDINFTRTCQQLWCKKVSILPIKSFRCCDVCVVVSLFQLIFAFTNNMRHEAASCRPADSDACLTPSGLILATCWSATPRNCRTSIFLTFSVLSLKGKIGLMRSPCTLSVCVSLKLLN
jgi:hypothetical protein